MDKQEVDQQEVDHLRHDSSSFDGRDSTLSGPSFWPRLFSVISASALASIISLFFFFFQMIHHLLQTKPHSGAAPAGS